MPGTMYLNIRTNAIVETLGEGPVEFTVATVKDDGDKGRPRKVRAASFHTTYLATDGLPHAAGYVPVSALPVDHPRSTKTENAHVDLIDNLDELSDTDLALVILEQQKALNAAKAVVERAKDIAKARRGNSLGTLVHGGIALVYTSGVKFDGATAKRNLSKEDYAKILLPKPDAGLARALFKADDEKLDACMKDNGPTLTVRAATEDDRERAEDVSAADSGEDFSYTI